MKRKNIFRYIILPLFIIMTVVCWYVYSEYNRSHKDTENLQPDYSLHAAELIKEFSGDEQASNKKYWDKVIAVNGVVKEKKPDEDGVYTIALGDTADMSSVRCSIDSVHNRAAINVIKGATVTIKGICTGFTADELLGSDVFLVRCVIETHK